MIELKHSYLGFRCPICGKNIISQFNRFQVASGIAVCCPDCNTPVLKIVKNKSACNIDLSCFACGGVHNYSLPFKSFLSGKNFSFGCKENVVDVLFAGKPESLECSLNHLEREIASLTDDYYAEISNQYGDSVAAALKIIEKMAKEQKILCLCGSNKITLNLSDSGIELVCQSCDASEFIPAETDAHITALTNRHLILIK